MGYGSPNFRTIAELRRRGDLAGVRKVMDLGAQECFLFGDHAPAVEFLEAFGVSNPDPSEVKALVDRRFVKHLWERVGVEYQSTDYDAQFETVFIDLNYEDVPPAHRGAYDLVTNCGTTEHVVNQMNSFRVVHDLTRHGGYMLHDLPWSGMFNHGLFNYKPHLFWRLCQSNYYNWRGMWLRAETHDRAALPDNIVSYCTDKDKELYRQFFSFDGLITVVLQKAYDMPFVCPLDMEHTMILPEGDARRRYWTLDGADGVQKIPQYARTKFPNDEPTPGELRAECAALKRTAAAERARAEALAAQVERMEASAFWRVRAAFAKWKRAAASRLRPGRRVAG